MIFIEDLTSQVPEIIVTNNLILEPDISTYNIILLVDPFKSCVE